MDLGSYDYVIVGAGTAGCLLANRLSADPGVRVLLLEAGGRDNYIWIHIPVGYLYCMNNPRTDWCYKTEPIPGLAGRVLDYPRGRVMGGCSSINGMIYMRGQARDYDQWRQLGNVGWGWDDVLPFFMQHEDYSFGADDMHAQGGEMRIEAQRLHWPILDAFRAAAIESGIPATNDFNRGDNEGVDYFQVTQRGGVRVNANKAFVRPVRDRPNLRVVTKAQASRLRFDGTRVTGLDVIVNGTPATVPVTGEVVLTCGAIGTPQVLELSGIGDPERLGSLGVPVVADLRGVGENLQDHLQVRMVFKVQNARTLNTLANNWLGKMRIGLNYIFTRSGPMAMAPSQLGAFTRSDEARETPNLEYHIQPLSLPRFGQPLDPYPAITTSVCNLRPDSRGSVHATSPDVRVAAAIQPNYLAEPSDRHVAAQSVRLTRRIMTARAMAPHAPEEVRPGAHVESDEDLAHEAGQIASPIFHPVGTAKMGSDDCAVVDDRLRVHGLQGLRIADASIMPTITSGNTNEPVLMIAEKAAAMMREDRL